MTNQRANIVSAPDKAFAHIGYDGTLARAFSPKVLSELAENGFSSTLTAVLRETSAIHAFNTNISLRAFFDTLYYHLLDSYRNEYVYKNALAQKLLINKHSLNDSSILTEFRVSGSKADIMIVNGTSNIYEIKTDLDNLDRLSKQLSDYQEFSEFVSVVTSKDQAQLIKKSVADDIGILILSPGFRLQTLRRPTSGLRNNKLSHDVIFDSLRRDEYTAILEHFVPDVPDLPNAVIHREYRKLFRSINIVSAHAAAIDLLKNRNDLTRRKSLINKFPLSLKLSATTMTMDRDEARTLLSCLNNKTKDALASNC